MPEEPGHVNALDKGCSKAHPPPASATPAKTMSTQRCRKRDIEIPSIVDSRGKEKRRLVLRKSVNRKERKEAESTPSHGSCQIFLAGPRFSSNDGLFRRDGTPFSDFEKANPMRRNHRLKTLSRARETGSRCDPASLSVLFRLAMIPLAIGGNFPPGPSQIDVCGARRTNRSTSSRRGDCSSNGDGGFGIAGRTWSRHSPLGA